MNATNLDSDSPWKDILETYFPQFISFFAPVADGDIDWDRGHEFLDKELQQIFPESAVGGGMWTNWLRSFAKMDHLRLS